MNKNIVKIELTKYEMELACYVAMRRQIDAEFAGRTDRVNRKSFTEGLQSHVLGCFGELSVARVLGTYWSGSNNTFHSMSDLHDRIEVRHRSNHDWDLIVREEDSPDSLYVLSTGNGNCIFVHGGILGKDAKMDRFSRNYGNKRPAFFVPSDELTISPREIISHCNSGSDRSSREDSRSEE